uniref:Glycylpeptide N-tetradecanoyltransferase n=1 Tax=viral metagenome TaxID=1070528 RepID=A0A6C0JHC1_9ZZZZ
MIYIVVLSIITFSYFSYYAYIKLSYPFWSLQPVPSSIPFCCSTKEIIDEKTLQVEKYIKLLDVYTYDISNCDNQKLNYFFNFFQRHSLFSLFDYNPEGKEMKTSLTGYSFPVYMSTFLAMPLLESMSAIASVPVFVSVFDRTTLSHAVKYLALDKGYKKEENLKYLLQTHMFNVREKCKNIYTFLYRKRNGVNIVTPLCVVTDTHYTNNALNGIIHFKNEDPTIKLISITEESFILFSSFLKDSLDNYSLVVHAEKKHLLHMISNDIYKVFVITENNVIHGCFIFSVLDEKLYLHASIKIIDNEKIFFNCFITAIRRLNRKYTFSKIIINNTTSNDFLNIALRIVYVPLIKKETFHYILHNYSYKYISPENAFILY